MTNCPTQAELLTFLDGESINSELHGHLEQCADCQETLDRLKLEIDSSKESSLDLAIESNAIGETRRKRIVQVLRDALTQSVIAKPRPKSPENQTHSLAQTQSEAAETIDSEPRGDTVDHASLTPAARQIRCQEQYQVGSVVAKGGMGSIHDAQDPRIRRRVALKVMHPGNESAENVARFVNEAQITGQLEHPSIVPVHDLGVDENGNVFYTMKFIHGQTLKAVINQVRGGEPKVQKEFSRGRLLGMFVRVCDAIEFAHSKGVIHRDLKPENVMIGEYGEVLVVDWGLAKILEQSERHREKTAVSGTQVGKGLQTKSDEMTPISQDPKISGDVATMDGTIMGTPAFMSPEQALGNSQAVDERTDVYALGAVLYNILTLHPPVHGKNLPSLLRKVQRGEIDPLSTHESEHPSGRIPGALQLVCMKALSRAPDDRYSNVQELRKEIEAYQSGFATRAESAGLWRQFQLFVRRHKAVSAATLAALCLLLVLGVGGPIVAIRQANLTAEATAAKTAETVALGLANQARETADRRKEDLRKQLYQFEMIAASSEALKPTGSPKTDRWIPTDNGEADLRGWEWYFASSAQERPHAIFKANGGHAAFCWTADGSRLLIADGNDHLTDWEVQSGRVRRQWKFQGKKRSVKLASNPDQVIFDSREIFSLRTGQITRNIKIPANKGFGVSPDANHWAFAKGLKNQYATMLHFVSQGETESPVTIEHQGNPWAAMTWSHDGNRLACGSNPFDWVRIYDKAGKRLAERDITEQAVNAMNRIVWSQDDSRIATSDQESIYVLDSNSMNPIGANSISHGSEIYSIDFDPNGTRVVSAGADRIVRVFNIESGDLVFVFRGHTKRISHVQWSPNGKWIASSGGGIIRVWDAATTTDQRKSIERISTSHLATLDGVSTLEWHPTNNRLALQGPWMRGYSSAVLDVPSRKVLFEQFFGKSLSWEPAGRGLVTSRMGGGPHDGIQLWDKHYSKVWEQKQLCDHVAWSADCNFLFTVGGGTKHQALYNLQDKTEQWKMRCVGYQEDTLQRVRFSPNDREIFLNAGTSELNLIRVEDGEIRMVLRGHGDSVTDADWRFDSNRIATASRDHTVRIWDVNSGESIRSLIGHGGIVHGVHWSPDGSRIATVSNDQTVRLWDPETGAETARFEDLAGYQKTIDWSDDGTRIALGGSDGVLVLDASEGYRQSVMSQVNTLIQNDDWEVARKTIDDGLIYFKGNRDSVTVGAGWWQYLGADDPRMDSSRQNPDLANTQKWKRIIEAGDPAFSTHRLTQSTNQATVFMATRVYSDTDQEVAGWIYGRGKIAVWQGDREIMSCTSNELPLHGSANSIALSKGWNTFFVEHANRQPGDPLQFTLLDSVPASELRTWSRSDGKPNVNAIFERVDNGNIYLADPEMGKVLSIPVDQLSEGDQSLALEFAVVAAQKRDALTAKWAQEVMLGSEYGGQGLVSSRWTKSPTISYFHPNVEQKKILDRALLEINEILSETPIQGIQRLSPSDHSAEIQVFVVPQREFSQLARRYGFRYANGNQGYTFVFWNLNHEIYRGIVLLASDKLKGERLKHYALEQIIQSLGLLNNSAHFKDSISYSGPLGEGKAVHLSELDKDLLRFFYRHVGPGKRPRDVQVALKKYWLAGLEIEPDAPEPAWVYAPVEFWRPGAQWQRAQRPISSLPKRLEDLATGKWVSLFDEPDDIEKSPGFNPSLHKWSDGIITLTSMDVEKTPSAVFLLERPRPARRMIFRALMKHERGDHTEIALTRRRKGKANELLKLARKKDFYQLEFGTTHFRVMNSHLRSSDYEDFALVLYNGQIAVYLNGEKAMDFVGIPEMDEFLSEGVTVSPQLSIFDPKDTAKSQFKNARLMILE